VNVTAFAVVCAAAAAEIAFVRALQPASVRAALLLAAWLLTPRAMSIAWLIVTRRSRAHAAAAGIVTTLVVAGALSRLVDAIFVHPDAQGAAAVVLTPIYEMGALAVLAPISAWLASRLPTRR
jgi:hypothetical protein